jgi:hypothetical protein
MLILSAVSYAAESPDEKLMVVQWLKEQGLSEHASENEIAFLHNLQSTPKEIVQMSWRSEAAYTLARCLQLIDTLPPIDRAPTDDEIEKFHDGVPAIGSQVSSFLDNLELRSVEEIFDENIVNELVTSYLRDLMITGQPNLSNVVEDIPMERHYVLNWLRKFDDNDDWDFVDTST